MNDMTRCSRDDEVQYLDRLRPSLVATNELGVAHDGSHHCCTAADMYSSIIRRAMRTLTLNT